MRMAKAPKEHIDQLRIWLQFNQELCKINPLNEFEWSEFKKDWEEEDGFKEIIKHCKDGENFNYDYYWDYFERHISHIFGRIIMGYEVLIENVCDPELHYLEYKPEIKTLIEQHNKNTDEQQ